MTISSLELRLAKLFGRKYCVLFGNASTAIYAALQIVRRRHGEGEVIVPSIICPAVPDVVAYSGFAPIFADVDLPECTINLDSVRALINERTRAIIPTHIFGNAAPVAELEKIARARGIALIEDAVPAMGGTIDGRSVGSFGSFSVHSFGRTKIADAGGGGALTTDDEDADRQARDIAATLPPLVPHVRRDYALLSHRNLYFAIVDLLRLRPAAQVSEIYRRLMPEYREFYLRSLPADSPCRPMIESVIDVLPQNLSGRRDRAAMYEDSFSLLVPDVSLCTGWHTSGAVWRYTVLVSDPHAVLEITSALRKNGSYVWNLYWSMAQIMYDQRLPNADHASQRLLNLPLDPATEPRAILEAAKIVRQILR